jgi:hypothetical protein
MYIAIIVILFLIARYVYKNWSLTKLVKRLNIMLYVDRNPEEYIKECDKLLEKSYTKKEKDINLLQKSTGLFYAGRFNEVKEVLLNKMDKIPINGQHIYYQALVLSMLFGGNIEEGHKIFEDAKEILTSYKRTEGNSKGLEFIFAVDDLYQGKYEDRKEFFLEQCENGRNYYRKAMANFCVALIYKNGNKVDEMNRHLELAKDLGINSFVEKLATQELE